jgi:hypothetical protein
MQTATTCPTCGGTGQSISSKPANADAQGMILEDETVSIKIPAGVVNEMQLKVSGKGNDAPGNGIPGDVNGPALSASFNYPSSVAADTLNNLFVADVITNTIRKINLTTATVSTYVGASGQQGAVDGNGIAAKFKMPTGIAYNRSGRNLWVGDNGNHTVRRVTAISTTTLTLSISGGSAICAGAPASFTISPAGLYNYTILENGQTLGTSANGNVTVNGLTQGNHTLTAIAFDASGATASSNTLNVTVYPSFSPTITSSAGTAICDGASLTLTATTGTAYSWSNGSTAQSIVVNTAGSFTVSVTNSNGCVGSSAPISITVQAAPVATITASFDNTSSFAVTHNFNSKNKWIKQIFCI